MLVILPTSDGDQIKVLYSNNDLTYVVYALVNYRASRQINPLKIKNDLIQRPQKQRRNHEKLS